MSNNSEHKGHHLVPIANYFKVITALLILTVITVAAAQVHLGHWNTPLAMAIATVKAFLVMAIFMGLKYDTRENIFTISCSFIFLGIFVFLTWSDLFYRIPATPIKPDTTANAAAPLDLEKALKASPEAIAHGKELFKTNCATCHGEHGAGDGPAASALNPHPRNFTNGEKFKQGDKLTQVVKTITTGVKGSAMAGFPGLPLEDRFALAHFVRSLESGHANDTPADIEASGFKGGEKAKPKIPIDAAIQRLIEGK